MFGAPRPGPSNTKNQLLVPKRGSSQLAIRRKRRKLYRDYVQNNPLDLTLEHFVLPHRLKRPPPEHRVPVISEVELSLDTAKSTCPALSSQKNDTVNPDVLQLGESSNCDDFTSIGRIDSTEINFSSAENNDPVVHFGYESCSDENWSHFAWQSDDDDSDAPFQLNDADDSPMESAIDSDDDCNADPRRDSQQSANDKDHLKEPRGMFALSAMDNLQAMATMRSNVPEAAMLSMIISISLRHHFTYEATVALLKMMSKVTAGSKLPTTKQGLWKVLQRNDESAMVRHLYCRSCKTNVGKGKIPDEDCLCGACGPEKNTNSLSYFIQVSLVEQLQQLFCLPGIADSLRYRYTRTKKKNGTIEDIYDGREYQKLCEPGNFLSSEYNYSFTLNTDGCKVANSSGASAWPILLTINELPPHARKKYMLLAGVWVETSHPVLNSFLLPTIKELRSLYETGITWSPDGIIKVTSKFVTVMCTVDSIARPAMLNMAQFNGAYGCTFCYHEGKAKGLQRVYPFHETDRLRTNNEIRENMLEAHENNTRVRGVNGFSALKALPQFDLARGMIVDSMHNLFLGVVKQHCMLLLFGKASDPWYCGSPKRLAAINKRLLKIKPPTRISRKPRPVQTMKMWKASEWRNWLLYYCTSCLEGIIRGNINHLALLSRAAYILNKDCIGTEELHEARSLLNQYCKMFQETFGESKMSFNVHLVTHLCDTVENWGPLWANNAFMYESFNKKIIDSVSSANARPLQIVTRFLMNRFLERLMCDSATAQETKNAVRFFMEDGKKYKRKWLAVPKSDNDFKGLGAIVERRPSAWQSHLLRVTNFRPTKVSFFKKAIIKGTHYRCQKEHEETRYSNKYVSIKNVGFAEILNIVCFQHNGNDICGLFVKLFNDGGIVFEAQHITKIVPTSVRSFVRLDDIENPVLVIPAYDHIRAIKLANTQETD